MFEIEEQKINEFRKNRNMFNIIFSAGKLLIAYALITYIEYGIFIVLGYIFYTIENTVSLQHLNIQKTNIHISNLKHKLNELENKK